MELNSEKEKSKVLKMSCCDLLGNVAYSLNIAGKITCSDIFTKAGEYGNYHDTKPSGISNGICYSSG